MSQFERPHVERLRRALRRGPPLIQIVVGPRQVGKTTAARTVERGWPGPTRYAAADLPIPPGPEWVESHWNLARRDSRDGPALLVLDEIQKVAGWSEVVKALWDADRAAERALRVILLGSSALLLARGMSESLAGRYFLHRLPHWSYRECRQAFGWGLDRWILQGGYPGAVPLVDDEAAWKSYVRDSIIEAVLARDVLALERINKPALLRQLFALAAGAPGRIVAYNKMLGQLHDAGNTTTLAHYLRLLEKAYLVSGLERYSAGQIRRRGSSPKLVLWNGALIGAIDLRPLEAARADPAWWGRLVENAVGAHLLNHLQGLPFEVRYWRDRGDEVDYVVETGRRTWALEVKSGRPGRTTGLTAFRRRYPDATPLIIGRGGLPLDEFFASVPAELLAG